jgi:hypothetical protein
MAEYEDIRTGRHWVFALYAHLVFVAPEDASTVLRLMGSAIVTGP